MSAGQILITGATGNVGGHLVRELCASGEPVRVLVRSPERADDLRGFDCEIAVGSYDDPTSLPAALDGVDRVFLLSPAHSAMARQEAALVDALPPDCRVVKLAAAGVDAPGPVSVRILQQHREVVDRLAATNVPTTVLAPMSFMQNLLMQAASITGQGVLSASVGGARISFVDVRDIAAVAAHVLTSDGHEGRTYTITGPEALSYREVADRMSAALGRDVRHVDVPPDQMRAGLLAAGLPEWLVDGLGELDGSLRAGAGATVTDEVTKATGRPARRIEDFLAAHGAAFRD